MRDKTNFDDLVDDTVTPISNHLDTLSLSTMLLTNKRNHSLFSPVLGERLNRLVTEQQWDLPNKKFGRDARLIDYFLNLVVCGAQEKAKQMLQLFPSLLTKKGTVTDLSGRQFNDISAFKYILWALDAHMAKMMLNCIPKTKFGQEIRSSLFAQYREHKETGVTYTINDQEITENHFSLLPLIESINYYYQCNKMDPEESNTYWCNIGNLQFELPTHFAQHYCEKLVPFYPIPDFGKDNFDRQLTIFNFIENRETHWFDKDSEYACLGKDFCIIRGNRREWRAIGLPSTINHAFYKKALHQDALALTELYKIRMEDYHNLHDILLTSLGTIETLIDENMTEIGLKLDLPSLCNLMFTSRKHVNFFRPLSIVQTQNSILSNDFEELKQVTKLWPLSADLFSNEEKTINHLLSLVSQGNQTDAERLISLFPLLLTKRGRIEDYSGRIFENITAFEYALWALDVRHMSIMMVKALPKNKQGDAIRIDLLDQFEKHKKEGISYRLNNKDYSEKHFNFEPFLSRLEIYQANFKQWPREQRNNYFCTEIGYEQTLFPAHIAQHYCDSEIRSFAFHHFQEEKFFRNLTIHADSEPKFWFSKPAADSRLGVSYAVTRGSQYGPSGNWAIAREYAMVPEGDIRGICCLRDQRLKDYESLGQMLTISWIEESDIDQFFTFQSY